MDSIQLEERARAGEKATKEQAERPELQDLSLEVLTDLALHNWKCIACGESVLRHSQPYRILQYKHGDPDNEVEYATMFDCYWDNEFEENFEVIKGVEK